MNKEDILSINDWIKISIKFSGVCLNCKKRISSGDYGYWSRNSKSVLHELCYNSLFFSSSAIKETSSIVDIDSISDKNNTKTVRLDIDIASSAIDVSNSSNIFKKKEKKTKCFICSKYINFSSDFIISLLKMGEKYNRNLDILYCYDCLENFSKDVYQNYKKKFMGQL